MVVWYAYVYGPVRSSRRRIFPLIRSFMRSFITFLDLKKNVPLALCVMLLTLLGSLLASLNLMSFSRVLYRGFGSLRCVYTGQKVTYCHTLSHYDIIVT